MIIPSSKYKNATESTELDILETLYMDNGDDRLSKLINGGKPGFRQEPK
jgi:hypothetical protein